MSQSRPTTHTMGDRSDLTMVAWSEECSWENFPISWLPYLTWRNFNKGGESVEQALECAYLHFCRWILSSSVQVYIFHFVPSVRSIFLYILHFPPVTHPLSLRVSENPLWVDALDRDFSLWLNKNNTVFSVDKRFILCISLLPCCGVLSHSVII